VVQEAVDEDETSQETVVADVHAEEGEQGAVGGVDPLGAQVEVTNEDEEDDDDEDEEDDEEEEGAEGEEGEDPDFEDLIASGHIKMQVHTKRVIFSSGSTVADKWVTELKSFFVVDST